MAFFDAKEILSYFMPPEDLTLSQWADKYAYLSQESSAEPGKWRSYPYQIGIMDAVTDPLVWKITLMKSARVGYSKILNHTIGYYAHHEPCPQLMVQPTVEDSQGFSKDEIAPMIRDTPVLNQLVSDPKSRNTDNTILKKAFPGGSLTLIGANSARGFRRITVRIVLFDECDSYPPSAGREGDQLKLGEMRTDTYWNRKVIIGSTPTIKGASRVETSFNESDKRYYYVPCPFCKKEQIIRWKNIKWPKDNPHRAYLECEHCGKEIPHSKKRWMVDNGVWRPTAKSPGHAGFWIWAGYSFSPNATWAHLATEFLEATRAYKNGEDPEKEKLKTFVNTRLAETWEDKGERIDDVILMARKEHFADEAPEGVLVITVGADIQKNRIEAEIIGWGVGYESWSLSYDVLSGKDCRLPDDPAWSKLSELLEREFLRPDGVRLHIAAAGIDTGYATDAAYAFIRPRQIGRVYALKGSSTRGAPLVGRPTTKTVKKGRLGLDLYPVGTDTAKDSVYSRLQIKEPGPGYCHFPDDRDAKYFDMLTAEEAKTRYVKGVAYRAYQLKPKKKRNEALDCRYYGYVACRILNPIWKKLKESIDRRVKKAVKKKEAPKKRPLKRKRKGFVKGWK